MPPARAGRPAAWLPARRRRPRSPVRQRGRRRHTGPDRRRPRPPRATRPSTPPSSWCPPSAPTRQPGLVIRTTRAQSPPVAPGGVSPFNDPMTYSLTVAFTLLAPAADPAPIPVVTLNRKDPVSYEKD